MIISAVMTRTPVFARPEMSITDASELMSREKVSKLPVLDKAGRVAGVFTRKDLMRAAPSQATSLDVFEITYLLSKITVEKAMSRPAVCVQEDEVVEEAARIMAEKDIGCLPVLRGSFLAGIVTKDDLFRAFVDMFAAGVPGVRVTFSVEDKPGTLAKVSAAVAELGGNILAFVTSKGDDSSHRICTMKASGVEAQQMQKLLEAGGAEIKDIR